MVKFINIPPTVKVNGNYKVNDFEMCIYPITQRAWKSVMGEYYNFDFQSEECPVEKLSYYQAQEFIQKLNQITNSNYRMPTVDEWEWAAQGGSKSNNYRYAGSNRLSDVAWDADNVPMTETQPVGMKIPNELGLYDMNGNVWEWCGSKDNTNILLKGGCYTNSLPYDGFNINYRGFKQDPKSKMGPYGFRLVKVVKKEYKKSNSFSNIENKKLSKEDNKKTENTIEHFKTGLKWGIIGYLISFIGFSIYYPNKISTLFGGLTPMFLLCFFYGYENSKDKNKK